MARARSAGLGDLGVQLGQFDGGEAHLIGQGLAVDEGGVQRRPCSSGSAALAVVSTK